MRHPPPQPPGPGQESVWDYPRPPRVEATDRRLRVMFNGRVIADTRHGYRVLETSHPPVYYLPPDDVATDALQLVTGDSWCEWKGRALYYDVVVGNRRAPRAAWTYPHPHGRFEAIRDHVAFYPALMDACYVDEELVRPQPGGFYGGWITEDVVGPFKGEPGSWGW